MEINLLFAKLEELSRPISNVHRFVDEIFIYEFIKKRIENRIDTADNPVYFIYKSFLQKRFAL